MDRDWQDRFGVLCVALGDADGVFFVHAGNDFWFFIAEEVHQGTMQGAEAGTWVEANVEETLLPQGRGDQVAAKSGRVSVYICEVRSFGFVGHVVSLKSCLN